MGRLICLDYIPDFMRSKKEDLHKLLDSPEFVIRGNEMGGMHASYEVFNKEFDGKLVFGSLPNGQCPVPHWGYVLKGSYRVVYADKEETYNEGDVYYIPPGHVPEVSAGTEVIEFSPMQAYAKTMEKLAAERQETAGS